MTRRSRRRPTSTRARKTCNAARPHSPGFTRSLSTPATLRNTPATLRNRGDASAIVAGLGGGLMTASPSRPVQLQLGYGLLLVQSGEQPADLMTGQRDQLAVVSAVGAGLGRGQDGQERAGEQGQDGPAMPGRPAADLVLVQGGQVPPSGEP